MGHESKVTSLDISGGKILAYAFLNSCVNSILNSFLGVNQFNVVLLKMKFGYSIVRRRKTTAVHF